jgi:hypothetical protein
MGRYVGSWTAPAVLTDAFVLTAGPVVPLAGGEIAEPEPVLGLADVPQAANRRGMLVAPSIPSRTTERLLNVSVVFVRLRTTCTPRFVDYSAGFRSALNRAHRHADTRGADDSTVHLK